MTTETLTLTPFDLMMTKESTKHLSDEALLLRIAEGDEVAYETFCQRYLNWAFRFDYSFLQNQAEAEDAVQEKFLRIWQRASGYHPIAGSKVTNYLMKIDKNICLDMVRKSYRKKEVLVSDTRSEHPAGEVDLLDFLEYRHNSEQPHNRDPEARAESEELLSKILAFTEETFNRRQYLVFWGFVSGLTYQEIAVTYNLALGSVRGYIARGFAAIRHEFKDLRSCHE